MQILKYKPLFFKLFIILNIVLFSCNSVKDYTKSSDHNRINVTEEIILASLFKLGNDNYFDFEIDGIKYTLVQYKTEVSYDGSNNFVLSNTDSTYILYATCAKTWQEHGDLRNKNKTLFSIRFQFLPDILSMEVLSNGAGYWSSYYVLEDRIVYEKIETEDKVSIE